MIFLTGDIHGDARLVSEMIKKYHITEEDTIVLLGDVGGNFYGDIRDFFFRMRLNDYGVPILCVHGNHEMRPEAVGIYQEIQWRGGIVYWNDQEPNLYFAKDGEVYDLEGYKTIAIGGAYSVDKQYRVEHRLPWFADEQPSVEIKARVKAKLTELDWKIDLVLSHTCPERYIPREMFLPGIDQSRVDRSTELWLGRLEEKLEYQAWYCGHWHTDKCIDKIHFLFHGVEGLCCK